MRDSEGFEVAAVRGVLASILKMIEDGATHIGVATDHVIESFRNRMWPGYKTGAGIEPDLFAQFPILEEALVALGIVVWPMVEFEADDALAAAAFLAAKDKKVDRIFICTPDKDLSQCVQGTRIVQLDRRKRLIRDEPGVIAKFGVSPASIPDYLAGRRCSRRLSRIARMGSEVSQYGSRALWPSRTNSDRLARVGT